MNHSLTILAFASLKELASSLKLQISSHNPVWESLIMTGSILFVTAMAALWALYYSKKKKRRKHHHHHHHREQMAVEVKAADDDADREQKKLRRRRRRSQPPMNPTLAQTGGLPPVRNSGNSSYLP